MGLHGTPLPNLCSTYGTRFVLTPGVEHADLTAVPATPSQGLESPLIPRAFFRLKRLSPVAHMSDTGEPMEDFPYELPPQGITRMIIAAYHPNGVMPPGQAPFKLRAVGPVNPIDAVEHRKGLLTPTFEIIP